MKLFCKSVLVVLLLHCSLLGFSQISSDSLNNRIVAIVYRDATTSQLTRDLLDLGSKYPADSLLAIITLNLTQYNTYARPDTALMYGFEALALATKIGSINGIADSYQKIGEIMRVMGNHPRAVEFTLKALTTPKRLY